MTTPRFFHRTATLCAAAGTLLGAAGEVRASAARPTPGALTPERLKLPSGPNSVRGLAGEPTVDPFRAEVGYRVPIELPGGFGGLAPALALSYSGALGNGPIGIGWTLELPRIQRSTRLGVPKYDASDELELVGIAGGRLVAIGGGEYRVEGMGQTIRVRAVDGGFELDDGKGVRYRLGTSAASRQDRDPANTVAWLVERQTNLMGEQIAYEYTRDQGQVYPSKITWGPGGVYGVVFDYAARADTTRSFRTGFSVATAKRLATITVTAFAGTPSGGVRRMYQLDYDDSFPVARLAHVTSHGVGGIGTWPVLTFHYAQPAPAQMTPIAGVGGWRLNSSGAVLVDLNGDGAADLLQMADGGHRYRLNLDGTFSEPIALSGTTQPITNFQLQDVDGDAIAELVTSSNDGWSVRKFTPTGWVVRPGAWPGTSGLALKSDTTARFADLDGDGLVDGIRWSNDGLRISRGTRTGMLAAVSAPKIGGTALPTTDGRFQDVNGDGLDDYVLVRTTQLDVFVGHGDGTFEPVSHIGFPFSGQITSPGDIELADLDRDGLLDLIRIQSGNVRWYHGKPDGSFSSEVNAVANPEPLADTVVVDVTDTNGNGSHDLVWSSPGGMWRMDLAGATTAGMLVEIENGLGLDVTLRYQSSHSLSAAARNAGSAWASEVPIAMPVPVHKTTALGPGETPREISYLVRNGFWDVTEQRFGGFLTAIVTTAGATLAETASVTTVYNAGTGIDRELRGTAAQVRIQDGTGKVLSTTTNTWTTMAIADLPDTPLLRRAIQTRATVEYSDVSPSRTTDVAYSYDALGRATHVVDSGRTDVTGDESVKDTTYADDGTTWIRDQVCEEKVSDLAGTVFSDVQYLFGDNQVQNDVCVVGKGWPRETRARLVSEARWVPQNQTRYDAHGNPIAVVNHGVERRMVYDPTTSLFPIEEHVTSPVVGDMAWVATWDLTLGALKTASDPTGHTTTLSYDSLGRFTGSAIDGRSAHQVVVYDWNTTFPKTTTWTFDGALTEVTTPPAAWSADSRWRQTVEIANGLGDTRYRAVRLADAQWIVSGYQERDPNGRVVFAGRPVIASQLELAARPTDAITHQVMTGDTLTYDPLGRVLHQTLPTGATRSYSYVAFERTLQEADLAPVHSVLNGQARAILTERSLSDGTHEIVQATYDPMGRLTQMTLSGGTVTRSFTYDTLGRLTQSFDPDLGTRTLTWDDGNRLLSETNAVGQTVRYSYDRLGRLSTRDTGEVFRYHYDDARPGAGGALSNLVGQLAWVEEPTGGVDVAYDELGRAAFSRRRIDSEISELTTRYAASGLVLGRSYDDGFALTYQYDPAGRLIKAGDLWSLLDQDPMGQPLHEQTSSGVDTRITRDVLGLPAEVDVHDSRGAAIYHVSATRNAWTAITTVTDLDGTGLDHTATYGYDGFARLTTATVGTGSQGASFGYAYDVLHNMTARSAAGPPRALGAFLGTYRYGEAGNVPRQLTSIVDRAGQVTHRFGYDAAGRQTSQDQQTMAYDASDRLLRVEGVPGGSVAHAYGNDGARVKTAAPDGSVSYFFGDGTALRHGVREHDVEIGSRVVARVSIPAVTASRSASFGTMLGATVSFGARALGLALLGLTLLLGRRWTRQRARAVAMAGLALGASCSSPGVGTYRGRLSSAATATFLHTGVAAGPTIFTDADGRLLEERRYEPFGVPIDAEIHTATGSATGNPDLVARDLNELNKRTEATTGWSDHGARWIVPETARWLSPDPPVAAPDDKFMFAPWALHPYQYVEQNPVIYWDPTGHSPEEDSAGLDRALASLPVPANPLTNANSWFSTRYELSPEAQQILGPLFKTVYNFDVSPVRFRFGWTGNASAITVGNLVTINKDVWNQAGDLPRLELLSHEITHSVQYERLRWGLPGLVGELSFLSRYAFEYPTADNYGVPPPLKETPITKVDPIDWDYSFDQIADRTSLEIHNIFSGKGP